MKVRVVLETDDGEARATALVRVPSDAQEAMENLEDGRVLSVLTKEAGVVIYRLMAETRWKPRAWAK